MNLWLGYKYPTWSGPKQTSLPLLGPFPSSLLSLSLFLSMKHTKLSASDDFSAWNVFFLILPWLPFSLNVTQRQSFILSHHPLTVLCVATITHHRQISSVLFVGMCVYLTTPLLTRISSLLEQSLSIFYNTLSSRYRMDLGTYWALKIKQKWPLSELISLGCWNEALRSFYSPYFKYGETEAQRGIIIFPESF